MRKTSESMSKWDERILEYIEDNGPTAPKQISDCHYIHVTRQHISNRMKYLEEKGYLNPLGNGVYNITKRGRLYLAGGYDAEREEYIENYNPSDGIRNYEHMLIELETKIDALMQLRNETGEED